MVRFDELQMRHMSSGGRRRRLAVVAMAWVLALILGCLFGGQDKKEVEGGGGKLTAAGDAKETAA